MSFFRIIIPNYNNGPWLKQCLNSVLNQTFTDWDLVFVDDCSTDKSVKIAKDLIGSRGIVLPLKSKRWNGGSRNAGMQLFKGSEYTLFLDSDDWFISPDVLQKLHDFIVAQGHPDCVRLPFSTEYNGDQHVTIMLDDCNAARLVRSLFVACWTICTRTEITQQFPENTLMEDAARHIKQCDVISYRVPVFDQPVVMHNKNNKNSCSAEHNMDAQGGKWKSSMYRFMADLLDLNLTHEYCIKRRDEKAAKCLADIKQDKYIQ